MSTITCTLTHKKFAPWGLFTNEEKPRYLIWLSEENMTDSVDRILLSKMDLERMRAAEEAGIIQTRGLEGLQQAPPPIRVDIPAPDLAQIAAPITTGNSEKDITVLLEQQRAQTKALLDRQKQELERLLAEQSANDPGDGASLVDRQRAAVDRRELDTHTSVEEKMSALMGIQPNNDRIFGILNKPAHAVKKEIKHLAERRDYSMSFFRALRDAEQDRTPPRKTVLSLLKDVMQKKISEMRRSGVVDPMSGSDALSNNYYDMIEDEEGEIEYIPVEVQEDNSEDEE